MNIDDIRCIIESVILPVVSWLASIFVRNRRPAPPKVEPEGSAAQQPATLGGPGESITSAQAASAVELPAGSDAWASYFGKQEALSQTAANVVIAAKPQRARWIKDFGPGALGAFLVTLGLLAFIYLSDTGFAYESTQVLLFAQLICIPASLVTGALFGAVGALLMKRIAQALHFEDRVQGAAITVASLLSGAVTGFLCGGFSMMAASL